MDKELLKAATSGDSTLMQALSSHDPSILLGKTPRENTCLHISSSHGHVQFCRDVLTVEESLLAAVNLEEETPLIAAVTYGHVALALFLLKRCCRQLQFRHIILQQDQCGFNALHHAIRNGHKDLALKLIEAEPALSQAVSKCNDSPLFFAVLRNFTDVCEKLIQTPLCTYSKGIHGFNCLHAAVNSGNQAIARMILEKRPRLARESDTEACTTPVRHATLYGMTDMLKLMLEHDSTLGYEINSGGSPLLNAAAKLGQVASAREILKYCPDAPYRASDGTTLLHEAVTSGHEEFVEFVLKTPLLRNLINMQDNEGETALHIAVRKYNPRMVVSLLSHEDTDATVLDKSGDSATFKLSCEEILKSAKTLNWNEVLMLMMRACPQDAPIVHTIHGYAKKNSTGASRKDAKSLTQTYTSNTSLVAILIATITFAAAFTMPGGYNNDAGNEGLPNMSKKLAFQVFLISDVLAMCSSFLVAFICIITRWEDYEFLIYYRFFTKKLMWFAYIATTTAFSTGLYTVLTQHLHWLAIAICVLVALLPIITWLLGKGPVLKLKFRLGHTFNSDLLDMV